MSPRILRSGAFAAFAAAFLLGWQVVIGLSVGLERLAVLYKSVNVKEMTTFLQTYAPAIMQLMTADDAFAIAYGLAFVAFAFYLMPRAQLLSTVALVLSLTTSLTDLSENSVTLMVTATVTQSQTLDVSLLQLLFWLGQFKYLVFYIAAILFAVALWEEGRVGKIFAILLVLFPIIGVAGIAIEGLVVARVLWMFVLLIVGGIFLVLEARKIQT